MSDDVHTALDTMKRERVRRLPVVVDDGVVQGMVAINDLVLLAGEVTGAEAPGYFLQRCHEGDQCPPDPAEI